MAKDCLPKMVEVIENIIFLTNLAMIAVVIKKPFCIFMMSGNPCLKIVRWRRTICPRHSFPKERQCLS